MVRHRCTYCKQDVGENGIRHKYAGGLFCEPCLKGQGVKVGRGFFGKLWDRVVDFATYIFRPGAPKRVDKRREEKIRVHDKMMATRALTIPTNPQSGSPQKR